MFPRLLSLSSSHSPLGQNQGAKSAFLTITAWQTAYSLDVAACLAPCGSVKRRSSALRRSATNFSCKRAHCRRKETKQSMVFTLVMASSFCGRTGGRQLPGLDIAKRRQTTAPSLLLSAPFPHQQPGRRRGQAATFAGWWLVCL
jgi:hypothetical protein